MNPNQQQPGAPQPGAQQEQPNRGQVPIPQANLGVPLQQQQQLLERFRGKCDIYTYMVDILVSFRSPHLLCSTAFCRESSSVRASS